MKSVCKLHSYERYPIVKRITLHEIRRGVGAGLILGLMLAIPVTCVAQTSEPLSLDGKFKYHAIKTVGPLALLGSAAYAGILQEADTPEKWGQGAEGYGLRFGSTVACGVIHGTLAFGLDSALHQDPRYFRAGGTGFWRRAGHAVRGTILTRTDSGGETFSTWRFGSAYGAAFLSNQWYPGKLNTVGWGIAEGTMQIGFDLASNLGSEFWPDIKRKVFRRK